MAFQMHRRARRPLWDGGNRASSSGRQAAGASAGSGARWLGRLISPARACHLVAALVGLGLQGVMPDAAQAQIANLSCTLVSDRSLHFSLIIDEKAGKITTSACGGLTVPARINEQSIVFSYHCPNDSLGYNIVIDKPTGITLLINRIRVLQNLTGWCAGDRLY